MLVRHWLSILKKWGITRPFLICPTKTCTSNDIFSNLKTLDSKNDVCDNENRCKVSLHKNVKEVKKKNWKQFEDAWDMPRCINKLSTQVYHQHWKSVIFWRAGRMKSHLHSKKPSHVVIVDDCQGSDMCTLSKKDFMNHVTIMRRPIPSTICYPM